MGRPYSGAEGRRGPPELQEWLRGLAGEGGIGTEERLDSFRNGAEMMGRSVRGTWSTRSGCLRHQGKDCNKCTEEKEQGVRARLR